MSNEMNRDASYPDEGCGLTLTGVRQEQGRVRLTLSTGEVLFMPRAMLSERRYRAGMPFDRAAFDAFIESRAYSYAMERAGTLLSVRSRSKQELRDALTRSAYPQQTVSRVMDYLEQAGYLDDSTVAEHFAASRQAKGYGARRIRLELQRKGIDAQIIEETLGNIDGEAQTDAALRIARKVSRGKDLNDPKDRRRLLAALARRGMDYALSKQVIEALIRERDPA